MAVDEQYAQALRELTAAKARIKELEDAAFALLVWDSKRNFIVPYKVRDQIIAALNRPLVTHGVGASRELSPQSPMEGPSNG